MPPLVVSDINNLPVTVDSVIVSGVQQTDSSLLKKQFTELAKSSNLNELFENVRESRERLVKLGVFKSVFAVVDVSDNQMKKDGYKVIFKVEEKRLTSARLSVTHGTDGLTKGNINLRLNNFGRHAEVANIDVEMGSNKLVSRFATLSKPLENNPYVRLSIGGTEGTWDHYWAKFLRHERSIFVETQADSTIGRHKFQWDAAWRETQAKDDTTPWAVRKESGSAVKISLRHVFESDTRPDLVFPESGYLVKLTQEMASIVPGDLTGQINGAAHGESRSEGSINRALQLKLEANAQKPFRIFDWLVTELTFSTGFIHSLTRHPVHIADRFFIGGPLELRGFQWRSVGPTEPLIVPHFQSIGSVPVDAGDIPQSDTPRSETAVSPVGAEAFYLSGLHLYTPLPYWGAKEGSLAAQFRLHGFCLGGAAMNSPYETISNCFGSAASNQDLAQRLYTELKSKHRTVIGAGLVIRFAGVVRMEINYCIPLMSQPGDQMKPGFSFGFGMYYM